MQTIQRNQDNRGVLTLHMDRPTVHNAFDADMIRELTGVLQAAEQNADVRLLVITGTGTCFSAGADLNWMRRQVTASRAENERDALTLAKLLRTLNYLSKPTIARINGAAFGGGLGLLAACDITIAADTALFGVTETRLGLVPAVISPYVCRRIGERYARRYFLTGERFDSQQALAIGLVQQCVAAEDLDSAVNTATEDLIKGAPLAVTHAKRLVFKVAGHDEQSQESQDAYTAKLIADLRISAEGQEGLTAFLEKRKPVWVSEFE